MNVVRALPLIVLAAALSACAGKPARSDAPVADTLVPASPTAATDTATDAPAPAAEPTPVASGETATANTPPATDASAGTSASAAAAQPGGDDDFDALYGADGAAGNAVAYDP